MRPKLAEQLDEPTYWQLSALLSDQTEALQYLQAQAATALRTGSWEILVEALTALGDRYVESPIPIRRDGNVVTPEEDT